MMPSHTKRKKKPIIVDERHQIEVAPAPALSRYGTFNLRLSDAERAQLDAVTVAMSNERKAPITCAEAIRRLIFDAYKQNRMRKAVR